MTVKYLTYVPAIDSSLQAVGSLSTDNWGIGSGALELQWTHPWNAAERAFAHSRDRSIFQ